MNILFIDDSNIFKSKYEKFSYNKLGYFLRRKNNNYYLSLNQKSRKQIALILILRLILRKDEIVVIRSKKVYYFPNLECTKRKIVEITEQNNLLLNDKLYIDRFLKERKIQKQKATVLIIIDELDNVVKKKIIECIKEYKSVDIFVTRIAQYFYVKDFVKKIDEEYGTTTQTIDKMPKLKYNILLVFSKKDFNISSKSSFILDYNNSDLDTNSNAYKVYLKNTREIKQIFNSLGMIEENYWKTKLGKLYIYKKWNTLDR